MSATVYIVHAVDTEGPLYESLGAKFQRLRDLFQIDHIETSWENFQKLQNGEIDLGGMEKRIMDVFKGHLIGFMSTWTEVDVMLNRVMAQEFRNRMVDSDGQGWIFNWFCLDHINFKNNPRRRDIGYHNIFDHYQELLQNGSNKHDGLQWHFHPMSTYQDAHRCATHYFRSTEVFDILNRKIIERDFFPSAFRAGFQAERPDSHWFLEQWIPFDLSNMATDDSYLLDEMTDFRNGRSGNWREAPADWSVYNPSHDDYQKPGDCRRYIGRALNPLNRIGPMIQEEMDKAFKRAADGQDALVGVCSHDFRDMGAEINFMRDLIRGSLKKYPGVSFKFSEVNEAFRSVIWPNGCDRQALELSLAFVPESDQDVAHVDIEAVKGDVFGPQPWLAMELKGGRFVHDNLDFSSCGKKWSYAFHGDTLKLEDVKTLAVAANDKYGNTSIRKTGF